MNILSQRNSRQKYQPSALLASEDTFQEMLINMSSAILLCVYFQNIRIQFPTQCKKDMEKEEYAKKKYNLQTSSNKIYENGTSDIQDINKNKINPLYSKRAYDDVVEPSVSKGYWTEMSSQCIACFRVNFPTDSQKYMLPGCSNSVSDVTEDERYGERRICMKCYHSQHDILEDQTVKNWRGLEIPPKKKKEVFIFGIA